MAIQIVIIDDHQLVRDGLTSLMQDLDADIEDHRARRKRQRGRCIRQSLEPDIILIDVAMPGINGIDATRTIVGANPDTKVIAVTMHAERTFISGMLQAGAMGYIRKESAFEEISEAISAVNDGRVYLGDGIAAIVADDYRRQGEQNSSDKPHLTDRETQVLSLIAEGLKTREIAAQLFVSEKTVETHRRQISRKLELYSVAELTKYAIREGLTSVD